MKSQQGLAAQYFSTEINILQRGRLLSRFWRAFSAFVASPVTEIASHLGQQSRRTV